MGARTTVQGAIYNALTALGLRVYDAAPQTADGASLATFPYVEIGQIIFAEFDDKAVNGFDFVARVHVRSRSGSYAETLGIQEQIYARLHYGELTLPGQRLILLRQEQSFCDRLSDGSFHGVSEYRGLIEAA